jgi:hypothetical protein
MKIGYGRFLSAFLGLAAFAVAGRAQAVDQINVNIPYEFVVEGKTLPAGNYTVRRINYQDVSGLSITSFENHTGVLLIASEVSDATQEKPTVSFQQVGDQHILSKIETAEHVFTIPVSNKPAVQVAMKKQTSPANSGTSSSSGSN